MRKVILVAVMLVILFSLAVTVHAAEAPTKDTQALYEEYAQIIYEANETYGLNLTLLPYDQIEDFCSVEEFASTIDDYCRLRSVEFSSMPQSNIHSTGARGVGVVTVPNVKTKTYEDDTITITFYGTFEVRQDLNGTYYIASKSFVTYTASTNGNIHFVAEGTPTTRVIDGGRTTVVTQNFRAYIRGTATDLVPVSANYYMSPATGNISAI